MHVTAKQRQEGPRIVLTRVSPLQPIPATFQAHMLQPMPHPCQSPRLAAHPMLPHPQSTPLAACARAQEQGVWPAALELTRLLDNMRQRPTAPRTAPLHQLPPPTQLALLSPPCLPHPRGSCPSHQQLRPSIRRSKRRSPCSRDLESGAQPQLLQAKPQGRQQVLALPRAVHPLPSACRWGATCRRVYLFSAC